MTDSSSVALAERLGSRVWSVLRFCVAVIVSACLTIVIALCLPRRLSVVTDIVGYPIHSNYNVYVPFWNYYLSVLFFPACALVVYHLIGLRWPNSRWPICPVESPLLSSSEENGVVLVLHQIVRALAVGVPLGLGWILLDVHGDVRFWRGITAVAVAYAMVPLGIAAVAAWQARSSRRFAEVSGRLNALLSPLTIASLYAASAATRVRVVSDQSVHAYPWLPGWAAATVTAVLLVVTLVRVLRARDVGAVRHIEAQGILFVAAPVVTFLYTARLPPPLGGIDLFHFGEFLTGASLFKGGAFPWRDSIFIHGLLQDVLTPLAGIKIFGDSVWGAWTGFTMLGKPFWWIANYFLFAYLFRRNSLLLIAALAVPLCQAYVHSHWRFAPLPLILLALAALLERATLPRAFVLALALFVSNLLVPELAYAVPACGAALLGFELSHYRRNLSLLANLARTVRVAMIGLVLAGLWFVFLAHHQAAGAFLHYYATFAPGHELTGGIRISSANMADSGFVALMILPPAMVLLAIWYVVAVARTRRELDVRDWVMLALTLITAFYYKKFLGRPDMHVAHSAAPTLPLLYYAIYKLMLLGKNALRSRAVVVVGSIGVLTVTLLAAPPGLVLRLSHMTQSFSTVAPARPTFDRLGWSEDRAAEAVAVWKELGGFLEAYLESDESIFDFTNQPGLYHYLLGRRPATRYYHVSMAIRRSTQLDLLQELDRARPKLVVFHSANSGLPEWDGIPNVVRHYEISRYLLRHYRPFARLRDQVFYQRNDLALEPRAAVPRSIEYLVAPAAYAGARACDWGYAPSYLRVESLVAGATAERRNTTRTYRLALTGWAADAGSKQPAREVVALVGGMFAGHAVPDRQRPDVASALGSPAAGRAGFSIIADWPSASQLSLDALRVYAISRDGKAWELNAKWRSPSAEPAVLMLGRVSPIPVSPNATVGWVDSVNMETRTIVTAFEFPEGVRLSDASGLELDADSSPGDGTVVISDQPISSTALSPKGTSWDTLPPISFRIPARASGAFRLMLDSCPQWFALRGRTLYVHHEEGIYVRKVRVLMRDGIQQYK